MHSHQKGSCPATSAGLCSPEGATPPGHHLLLDTTSEYGSTTTDAAAVRPGASILVLLQIFSSIT